jgi:hypothetical protein
LSFEHCSPALQLQYVVHGSAADRQLHDTLEHGDADLHPHATSSNNDLGAISAIT